MRDMAQLVKNDRSRQFFKDYWGVNNFRYFFMKGKDYNNHPKPDHSRVQIDVEAIPIGDMDLTDLGKLERAGVMGDVLRTLGSWEKTDPQQKQRCAQKWADSFAPWRTKLESDIIYHSIKLGLPHALGYVHPSTIEYCDLEPIRDERAPYGIIGKFLPDRNYIKDMLSIDEAPETGSFKYMAY